MLLLNVNQNTTQYHYLYDSSAQIIQMCANMLQMHIKAY